MIYHPASAYNTLPLLPPETDLENKAILKKAISASRALAELKGAVTNPNLFIDTITLQEARASLAIEHRVVPLGEAFKAAASGGKIEDPATRDVLRYRDALYHGIAHPSLTTDLFVSIVQLVLAPVFLVFYNLHILGQAWQLALVLPLGTWALVANGTFFAALSIRSRNRELLLPLILFPIFMPALLAMVLATGSIFTGDSNPVLWIKLLIGYDIIFTTISLLLFDVILHAE